MHGSPEPPPRGSSSVFDRTLQASLREGGSSQPHEGLCTAAQLALSTAMFVAQIAHALNLNGHRLSDHRSDPGGHFCRADS